MCSNPYGTQRVSFNYGVVSATCDGKINKKNPLFEKKSVKKYLSKNN
jgi:hypothetical protein